MTHFLLQTTYKNWLICEKGIFDFIYRIFRHELDFMVGNDAFKIDH